MADSFQNWLLCPQSPAAAVGTDFAPHSLYQKCQDRTVSRPGYAPFEATGRLAMVEVDADICAHSKRSVYYSVRKSSHPCVPFAVKIVSKARSQFHQCSIIAPVIRTVTWQRVSSTSRTVQKVVTSKSHCRVQQLHCLSGDLFQL